MLKNILALTCFFVVIAGLDYLLGGAFVPIVFIILMLIECYRLFADEFKSEHSKTRSIVYLLGLSILLQFFSVNGKIDKLREAVSSEVVQQQEERL